MLTESEAKFQSDQDYFRCPAIARGPPNKSVLQLTSSSVTSRLTYFDAGRVVKTLI